MEILELKKAIFTSTEVLLIKKNGNITIPISDIEWLEYTKPTLFNCLFASGFFPGGDYPGYLEIMLNKKIGKSKTYFVKIKYNDISKLPTPYLKINPGLIN